MDIKQALNLLTMACSKVMGNLQDHQAIQQALKVISDALNPEEVKSDSEQK